MFQLNCIRKLIYVSLVFVLYNGVAAAQGVEQATYWDCLVRSDVTFAGCVEDGPLSARLAGDMRRQLHETQAKVAGGGDDGQWALYSVRFEERRFLERLHESFDLSRRSAASLPRSIHEVVNELAVRVAQITGSAPNPALEELWTAETRAELAALRRNDAPQSAMDSPASPADESAAVGQRFVEVFGAVEANAAAALPVSEGQYARIGQFQMVATDYLASRDAARATELHNELVAFRDDLLARGEEVSPDVDALQRDILNGVLEAGA